MRATALLQRLPRTADIPESDARPKRSSRRKRSRARPVTRLRLAVTPVADRAPEPDTTIAEVTILARAQRAGGPIDNASYSCGCGFVFTAQVSTTVACPHCGAEQAW